MIFKCHFHILFLFFKITSNLEMIVFLHGESKILDISVNKSISRLTTEKNSRHEKFSLDINQTKLNQDVFFNNIF